MTHSKGHREIRCWACGRVIEEPIRGLCFECYSTLRQPGRIGHSLLDGPSSAPPFVTPVLVPATEDEEQLRA